MIRAVFFDIDGTLFTSNHRVARSTQHALKQLREKGILCGIATGRSWTSIAHVAEAFDCVISYNGQIIHQHGERVFEKALDPGDVVTITEYANTHQLRLTHGTLNRGDVIKLTGWRVPLIRAGMALSKYIIPKRWTNHVVSHSKSVKAVPDEPVYQCMMSCSPAHAEELGQMLRDSRVTRSNPYSVDIIGKETSKLGAIAAFCKTHDLPLEAVMAFGDGMNDMEMLQGVGLGVAMGNAVPLLKEAADWVTDSHNRNGIAKALEHYNII